MQWVRQRLDVRKQRRLGELDKQLAGHVARTLVCWGAQAAFSRPFPPSPSGNALLSRATLPLDRLVKVHPRGHRDRMPEYQIEWLPYPGAHYSPLALQSGLVYLTSAAFVVEVHKGEERKPARLRLINGFDGYLATATQGQERIEAVQILDGHSNPEMESQREEWLETEDSGIALGASVSFQSHSADSKGEVHLQLLLQALHGSTFRLSLPVIDLTAFDRVSSIKTRRSNYLHRDTLSAVTPYLWDLFAAPFLRRHRDLVQGLVIDWDGDEATISSWTRHASFFEASHPPCPVCPLMATVVTNDRRGEPPPVFLFDPDQLATALLLSAAPGITFAISDGVYYEDGLRFSRETVQQWGVETSHIRLAIVPEETKGTSKVVGEYSLLYIGHKKPYRGNRRASGPHLGMVLCLLTHHNSKTGRPLYAVRLVLRVKFHPMSAEPAAAQDPTEKDRPARLPQIKQRLVARARYTATY